MTVLDDLALARQVSDRAAHLALEHFAAGSPATTKPDGSVVTEADPLVEALLRRELAAAAPADGFVGEELGSLGSSNRTWILDPIDGTSRFARGDAHWRVQVALVVDDEVVVGVVTAPAFGRQWWASRGEGAFEAAWPSDDEDGRRLTVSRTASLEKATLDSLSECTDRLLPLPSAIAPPHDGAWCGGLEHLLRGEVDGFLADRFQVWDHEPWTLFVEEAGGRFSDLDGRRTVGQGGGLYSNGVLHNVLLEALAG